VIEAGCGFWPAVVGLNLLPNPSPELLPFVTRLRNLQAAIGYNPLL
jgi:hypothetical protein